MIELPILGKGVGEELRPQGDEVVVVPREKICKFQETYIFIGINLSEGVFL
jgi:hypothetical protein